MEDRGALEYKLELITKEFDQTNDTLMMLKIPKKMNVKVSKKHAKEIPNYIETDNNEGGESDEILDVELDNNYNVKVSNAFTPLLDNPFVSKSPPIATLSPPRSSIPAVTITSETPPKPNSDQLANSFQKFLQVFKDENNQLK